MKTKGSQFLRGDWTLKSLRGIDLMTFIDCETACRKGVEAGPIPECCSQVATAFPREVAAIDFRCLSSSPLHPLPSVTGSRIKTRSQTGTDLWGILRWSCLSFSWWVKWSMCVTCGVWGSQVCPGNTCWLGLRSDGQKSP